VVRSIIGFTPPLPAAMTKTMKSRNSNPKKIRLRTSLRVKFITSHRPTKKATTGLRRGAGATWFMENSGKLGPL